MGPITIAHNLLYCHHSSQICSKSLVENALGESHRFHEILTRGTLLIAPQHRALRPGYTHRNGKPPLYGTLYEARSESLYATTWFFVFLKTRMINCMMLSQHENVYSMGMKLYLLSILLSILFLYAWCPVCNCVVIEGLV